MENPLLKQTIGGILNAISERNIVKIQGMKIPSIPIGKQKLSDGNYKIGQIVVAKASSTFKEGTKAVVIDKYKENGYYYFVTDKMGTQRQQDIKAG